MEMDRMFSSLGQMQEQNEENLLSRAYWYLYLFRRHQFRWNLVMLMVMSACPCRWVTSMPCMPFVLNDSQIKTKQCDLTNQAVCFLLLFSGGIMVDCVATRCITVETYVLVSCALTRSNDCFVCSQLGKEPGDSSSFHCLLTLLSFHTPGLIQCQEATTRWSFHFRSRIQPPFMCFRWCNFNNFV